MTETVEIWRPSSATDAYGDPVPGALAKVKDYACRFAPNNPAEPVEVGRNAVISGGTVYIRDLDAEPDIRATDHAKIRGVTYLIDGEVGLWRRSEGFAVQFAVKKVTG